MDVQHPANMMSGPPGTSPLQRLAELKTRRRRARYAPRDQVRPGRAELLAMRLGVLVLLIGGWEALSRIGVINPFFWSRPVDIVKTALIAFRSGSVVADTQFTFTSTLIGFAIGTLGGVSIGLSFWWSRRYAATAEPFLIAFEAMPKLALAPIIVLVLGIGLTSKIAMATALVLVIQALNTYAGVRAVDVDLVRLVSSMGASRWQVFTKVVVPSTLPWLISGMRVTIGLSLAGAIVGEFIGSSHGLGRMIQYAGSTYEISLIWVGIFILAALSMVLYLAVGKLEGLMLRGLLHR
jgi:NitT/TauT family transport system permease protein